jgi:hypothetical protein
MMKMMTMVISLFPSISNTIIAPIGPPRPPSDEFDDQQIQNFYNIPYSHEIHLAEHTRIVSTSNKIFPLKNISNNKFSLN